MIDTTPQGRTECALYTAAILVVYAIELLVGDWGRNKVETLRPDPSRSAKRARVSEAVASPAPA